MKKVGIYVRVSTSRQEEGYSIPLQKERLIAYCKAKGWVVAGMFVDPGHSGSSLERPGMTALIEAVEAGEFDVILVYKLDRLSRSQKDTLYLIEDVFMANKTDFVSLQESFDTTTIYGRAMVGILSVFSQMERETITERTMMGRAGRAEEGLWHGGGTDPIGYDYIDGELVVNKEEAKQVQMVYSLYAEGFSVSEISRRMEGFKTKHGDWSHTSTIGNVLDNPLYSGTVHFDGVKRKGRHLPIVPVDIDHAVKKRRERVHRIEAAGNSEYLLTGMVFCKVCGARYFAHKRPNGSVVYSCHSRAKKNKKMVKNPACKAPHIPVADLDRQVEEEVFRLAADPSLINEIIKKRATEGSGSDDADRSEDIKRLDAELGRLMDLLKDDQLQSVEEISTRIKEIHAERLRLYPKKTNNPFQLHDTLRFRVVLQDVPDWSGLDIRGRRALLMQLIDRIHISDGGVVIDWSFL